MKKLLVLLVSVLCFSLSALAQVQMVKGTVFSTEDGEPIAGATVRVDGTSKATVTDMDGKFAIEAPASAKEVSVSYVGMVTKQAAIEPDMVVYLDNDVQSLSEVVVTGYGFQRKAAFTGAASTVSAA